MVNFLSQIGQSVRIGVGYKLILVILFICLLLLCVLIDFIFNAELPVHVITSWKSALGGDRGMDSTNGLLVSLY